MPFKSLKQARWGHTAIGEKALGGKSKVKEWDQLSKDKDLPMQASVPQDPALPVMPNSTLTPPLIPATKHGFAMNGEHKNG